MGEGEKRPPEHLRVVEFSEARFERMKPLMGRVYDLETEAFESLGDLGSRYAHGEAVKSFVNAADARTYVWSKLVREAAGISDEDWKKYLDLRRMRLPETDT
ncbi:MAG: hypothetical protein AAB431_01960 [Patescibacteria group bacterium]